MAVTTERAASFTDTETRSDEMNSTIETWVDDLVDLVDYAAASEEFKAWLDVQSRFHDYSYRNTLLIKQQCPHATRVAGYNTRANELERLPKAESNADKGNNQDEG